MALYDRVELLCQAIGAQGREEADRIVAAARDAAARLVAAEEARRQEVLTRTRAEVQSQAHLDARNLMDRAELERKRQLGQVKEAVLQDIFAQAMDRLQAFRHTPEYRDWLGSTLAAALKHLEGEDFQVAAHPEEAAWLTPELLAEARGESGSRLEFTPGPDLPPGGFMLMRADGKVRYDQTFQGIIDRQRDSLRAELARRLWGPEGEDR